MKKIKKFIINNEAVSSVISLVLVMMIFFSVTGAIFLWAPGYIENEEKKAQSEAASKDLANADASIDSLGMIGDQSYADISIGSTGSVVIDLEGERFIPYWSYDDYFNFFISGVDDDGLTINMVDGGDDVKTIDKVIISYMDDTCFLAGTKVAMADGTYKNIEDIKVGEEVKAFDEQTEDIVFSKVSNVFHHQAEEMPDYYLVINDDLKVTPNHRFYSNDEWVFADDLEVGDPLFTGNSDYLITSIEKIYNKVLTFDLEIELVHNYFVSINDIEVLVHNAGQGTGYDYIYEHPEVDYVQGYGWIQRGDTYAYITPETHLGWWSWMLLSPDDGNDNIPSTSNGYAGLGYLGSDGLYFSQWNGYANDKAITASGFKVISDKNSQFHKRLVVDLDISDQEPPEGDPPVEIKPVIFDDSDYLDNQPIEYHYGQDAQYGDEELLAHEDVDVIGVSIGLQPGYWRFFKVGESRTGHLNEIYLRWHAPAAITGCHPKAGGGFGDEISIASCHPDGGQCIQVNARNLPYPPKDITETSAYVYGKIYDAAHEDGCQWGFRWGKSSETYSYAWFDPSGISQGDDWGISLAVGQGFEHELTYLTSGDLYYVVATCRNTAEYSLNNVDAGDLEGWIANYPYGEATFFTIPSGPVPNSLDDSATTSNGVTLIWDESAADNNDGVTVYTRILAKESPGWPASPYANIVGHPDYDANVIYICNTSNEIFTYPSGLDCETTYNVRAWTWAEEYEPTQGITMGAMSNDYDDHTFTTSSCPGGKPFPPDKPQGEEYPTVGDTEPYTTKTSDPDGDKVKYGWDWDGDSRIDEWDNNSGNYYDSGTPCTTLHYWGAEGKYEVQVAAMDINDNLGGFSPFLIVSVDSLGNPEIPTIVAFDTPIDVGVLGDYTASAIDPDGDKVKYGWDWGDGSPIEWSGLCPSGAPCTTKHSWATSNLYSIKVIAQDEHGHNSSAWSDPVDIQVKNPGGSPPDTPTIDTFDTPLEVDESGVYKASTTDPDGDDVYYWFDWDDGTNSGWLGPYGSGATCEASHSWGEGGVYLIKVKAKDSPGDNPSDWSAPVTIIVNADPGYQYFGVYCQNGYTVDKYYTSPIVYHFDALITGSTGETYNVIFYWGDGSSSTAGPFYPGWISEQVGEPVIENLPVYNWDDQGVYIIQIQVVEISSGKTSDLSAPLIINVNNPYSTPSNLHLTKIEQTITNDATVNPWPIVATDGLTGAVCINLFSDNYPDADDPAKGQVAFGCIWILDSGSISQKSGVYTTMLEGSNILSGSSSNMNMVSSTDLNPNSKSMIIEKDGGLEFDMSLIRGSSSGSTMTTGGTCEIEFEAKNIQLIEQPSAISRFKLLIVGDNKETWYTYLTKLSKANFDIDSNDDDTLVYVKDGGVETDAKQLVFSASVIHAKIQNLI